jgi:large subunit ribosomal protein L17
MRHRHAGRPLGRTSSHRKALIRNQITDLLRYERLVTTEAKAKELRPAAERVITLGKRGDLHARRQAAAVLTDRKILTRLFDELAPRYQNRPGGYTRITKLGPRRGDGAHMAQIELVESGGDAGIMAAPAVADPVDDPTDDTTEDVTEDPVDDSTDDTTAELATDDASDGASDDTSDDTSDDARDDAASDDDTGADEDAATADSDADSDDDSDPNDNDPPNETEDA